MKSGIELKSVRPEKDDNVRIDFELSSEELGSTYVFYEVVPYKEADLITSVLKALTKIAKDLATMSEMVANDLRLYEEVRSITRAKTGVSSTPPPDRKTLIADRTNDT